MIKYLNLINNNQSINYTAFLNKAKSYNIDENLIRLCFNVNKDSSKKKNFYFLNIKNEALFDSTFSKFLILKENKKVERSLHGDSKKAKSDFSFLFLKLDANDDVPWAIYFKKSDYKYNFKIPLKNKLIIIENEDSFSNIVDSFNNEDIDLSKYNFVLGFGNYISDRNFSLFLNTYSEVICFFDIDLGGLKTFASLDKNLTTKLSFFFSDKNRDYLKEYGKPISDDDYSEVNKYSNNSKLKNVVTAIKDIKKFAEQEIFQH